jgi:hypothetical protein
MRPSFARLAAACAAAALSLASAAAQDATPPTTPATVCRVDACALVFDWGNGATAVSFGTDRRYGAPADFESGLRQHLMERGFKFSDRPTDAKLVVNFRLRIMSARCDFLPGTNTDNSCKTVQDAAVNFTNSDPAAKQINSTRIQNRCGAGDQVMTNTQFAKFAADWIQWAMEGDQLHLSRPIGKC